MNEKIIVPLELDVEKVKMLVEFYNASDWEEMNIFVEEILTKLNTVCLTLNETTAEIMKQNPFSKMYL